MEWGPHEAAPVALADAQPLANSGLAVEELARVHHEPRGDRLTVTAFVAVAGGAAGIDGLQVLGIRAKPRKRGMAVAHALLLTRMIEAHARTRVTAEFAPLRLARD